MPIENALLHKNGGKSYVEAEGAAGEGRERRSRIE